MVQVVSLTLLALLLARVLRAPPGTWRYVLGAAALVLLASQLLPAGHPFRSDVAESSRNLGWLIIALVPVTAYVAWLRRMRHRSGVDRETAHPVGLVMIPDDRALVTDTETALEAETRAALGRAPAAMSLAWRTETGELAGHLRLRILAGTAEIEALRVRPRDRRRGLGSRLLAAAEDEARARGALRLAVTAGDWQTPEFFTARGFRQVAARDIGAGHARLWLEKDLA